MLRAKATKWLDASYIVGWLEERKIVELLFGKGVHFELISRSKDILRVLSEFRRYTTHTLTSFSERTILNANHLRNDFVMFISF
jgi:hypothetical protein